MTINLKKNFITSNTTNNNNKAIIGEFINNFLSQPDKYGNIDVTTLAQLKYMPNFTKEGVIYTLYKYSDNIYSMNDADKKLTDDKCQKLDKDLELELAIKNQLKYIFTNSKNQEFNFSDDMIHFLAEKQNNIDAFARTLTSLIIGTGEEQEVGHTAKIFHLLENNAKDISEILGNIFESFSYSFFNEIKSIITISSQNNLAIDEVFNDNGLLCSGDIENMTVDNH